MAIPIVLFCFTEVGHWCCSHWPAGSSWRRVWTGCLLWWGARHFLTRREALVVILVHSGFWWCCGYDNGVLHCFGPFRHRGGHHLCLVRWFLELTPTSRIRRIDTDTPPRSSARPSKFGAGLKPRSLP